MIRLSREVIEYDVDKTVVISEYALGVGSVFVVDVWTRYLVQTIYEYAYDEEYAWRAASRDRRLALCWAMEREIVEPVGLDFSFWRFGEPPSWWLWGDGEDADDDVMVEPEHQPRLF